MISPDGSRAKTDRKYRKGRQKEMRIGNEGKHIACHATLCAFNHTLGARYE